MSSFLVQLLMSGFFFLLGIWSIQCNAPFDAPMGVCFIFASLLYFVDLMKYGPSKDRFEDLEEEDKIEAGLIMVGGALLGPIVGYITLGRWGLPAGFIPSLTIAWIIVQAIYFRGGVKTDSLP